EPTVAPEINLFVSRPKFCDQQLHTRQQPLGNNRLSFQYLLGGFQFGGAREQPPQIVRAADAANFFPGGISFVEIESPEAHFAAWRFHFKRELDRRDGQDRDEKKRDQEQARAGGERGVLQRQFRFLFARNLSVCLRRRLAVTRQ